VNLFETSGKWLCVAGWSLFGLSMTLPVAATWLGSLNGWECLRIAWDITRSHLAGQAPFVEGAWGWYYAGYGVANAFMVASPAALRLLGKNPTLLRRYGFGLALASAFGISYGAISIVNGLKWIDRLNVGYYIWALSYFLTTVGTLNLALSERVRMAQVLARRSVSPPEELAAVREVDDCLGCALSAVRQAGAERRRSKGVKHAPWSS
jgi:hypothetical protein